MTTIHCPAQGIPLKHDKQARGRRWSPVILTDWAGPRRVDDRWREGFVLLDRRAERAAIDRVLDAVRSGLSGTLVLRGGPGVGKSTLLEYAVDGSAGPAGLPVSPVSSRRSAWSSAACTSCWSRACRSWTTCRLRSGTRCGSLSARKQGRRRNSSWWGWRRSRCCPGRRKPSRCCASSMTRTGSIPNRRRCSASSPAACTRTASASSPASANPPPSRCSSSFRRSRWTACPTPRPASCSARWPAEPSARRPSTGSWPTPAITRSRWWNSAPSTPPASCPAAPCCPSRFRWASGSRSTSCARSAACRQTPRRSRCWPRPTRQVTGTGCGARRPGPASTRMRPQPKRPGPACWSSPAARCGSATRCCGPRCTTARAPLTAGRHTVRWPRRATRSCACGTWPRRRSSLTRNSRPSCSARPDGRGPGAGTRPGPRCCGARPT